MVSRAVKLHPHIKKRLETLGFENVTVTDADKDGLVMKIREHKPKLVLMGAAFYVCSTPYMMKELLHTFPKLNIAALSVCQYPADLAMWFILNGVRSYVNVLEGFEEFHRGLQDVRQGKEYVSPEVQKRMDMRPYFPETSEKVTPKQTEVIRLLANGFTTTEVGNTLGMSKRTVDTHKTDIYTILNVRNEKELIRVAQYLGIISPEELIFFPPNYELRPQGANSKARK